MKKTVVAIACLLTLAFPSGRELIAADTWSEVKSPHFTVWSNGSDGQARSIAWQLEQIRSALVALYPWAKVDLPRPLLVFAVRDEASIKALAPTFWETKGSVRPVSVWVGGADQNYIVIRSDLRGDDRETVNPHTSTYFSYVNLVLESSFARRLPPWFSRGLAGVLSNTIVRDDAILLGPTIPWHLESLRTSTRIPVKQLVSTKRESPVLRQDFELRRFDAQAWALMHYLMFGENGTHAAKVNRFAAGLNTAEDPDAAFVEAFGQPEEYETGFVNYINRNIFTYRKARADADVKKERFAVSPIPPADAAAGRALLHVAMRRVPEANALIAEARRLDPNSSGAHVAEGVQFDIQNRRDEAKAAFTKAVELGSSNPHALYRAAVLNWPNPDEATLKQMEKHLLRAIELSPNFAPAHSSLADVKVALNQPWSSVLPLLNRSIALDPSSPWHRISAARALSRFGNREEALKVARSAVPLADDEYEKREVDRLLAMLAK